MDRPLLSVHNLITRFRSGHSVFNAVNDVSFEVREGETVGIVGESGSGKSVTSLSIMQLIPDPPGRIAGGSIRYVDRKGQVLELLTCTPEQVRSIRGNEIAMIFQEPMTSLNPVMRCGEQVAEAIINHRGFSYKEARQLTLELFTDVQLPLPELMLERYPHELSGGQKQRVMIAMAMSCGPRVLIADEPTTALDVTVQKTILQIMKRLQQKHGLGIIFITHDLGVVAELASQVVVMYKGRIVEQGPVSRVFANPSHPYTRGLLACRPSTEVRLRRLPVVSDFLSPSGVSALELSKDIELPQERSLRLDKIYSKEPVLRIRDLKTWFTTKATVFGRPQSYYKAVDGVSFDIFQGETLGLVGESGCGKTTLGRTILKLVQAHSGQVLYHGTDLLKLTEKQFRPYRRKLQIIFQDPYSSLNPRIKVGAAILEVMRHHGLHGNDKGRRQKALELLSKVGLESRHYNKYPHEFSGGQRQRICIARALACEPEFIICDESVSALDVSVQAQVLNLLNDLKREFAFTCIFISHDLGVVKFMSDRMIVMRAGKIEEMGDPDQLYYAPQTDYTRALIEAIPKLPAS